MAPRSHPRRRIDFSSDEDDAPNESTASNDEEVIESEAAGLGGDADEQEEGEDEEDGLLVDNESLDTGSVESDDMVELMRKRRHVSIESDEEEEEEDELDEDEVDELDEDELDEDDDDEEEASEDEQPRHKTPVKSIKATARSSKSAKNSISKKKGKSEPKKAAKSSVAPMEEDSEDEFLRALEDDQMDSLTMLKKVNPVGRVAVTARQRSRLDGDGDMQFLQLNETSNSKKKKRTKEEEALRRSELLKRRRVQSERKLEEDKAATLSRLLHKQNSRQKSKKDENDQDSNAIFAPSQIRYSQKTFAEAPYFSCTLNIPKPENISQSILVDFSGKSFLSYPKPKSCAVCGKRSKYSHSNGKRLCSLACFKKVKS